MCCSSCWRCGTNFRKNKNRTRWERFNKFQQRNACHCWVRGRTFSWRDYRGHWGSYKSILHHGTINYNSMLAWRSAARLDQLGSDRRKWMKTFIRFVTFVLKIYLWFSCREHVVRWNFMLRSWTIFGMI